jgi:flagellar hook-length control protein FliK
MARPAKLTPATPAVGALLSVGGAAAPSATAGAAPAAPPSGTGVPVTPDGLAAAITAMQQAGQNSAVLQLDPAGLGALSVHVALGHNAQINVQFVPAIAQTAQLLSNGLDGLRQAMAASGLTLGQVQVGGGQTGGGRRDDRPAPSGRATAAVTQATDGPDGIRAYA